MYKLLCEKFIYKNQNVLPFTYTCIQQCHTEVERKKNKSRVSNIKKYWFNRYIDYVQNFTHVLERNFPWTVKMYRVFSIGTKDFVIEMKRYLSILKKQNIDGIRNLTLEELQLNYTMRKDLIRICPFILISAIPFTTYVTFPLAYYFPRHILTSHYWTPQQKIDFMLLDHKRRLKHNKPLFRCMQAELVKIKNQTLKTKWNDIIACLGSGTHPRVNDIIACSELFSGPPYSLKNLRRRHVKELLAIHDISSWTPFKKQKLKARGMLIQQMDQAIQREGGITKLSNDSIYWALSFRGINPTNMSVESMQNWLDQWIVLSNAVNENNLSLLLHGPILLAYNYPSNWILIYS
ncbi:LETM1 domain-containing protein 1 [Hylaeus anthracinus]|uniref:LETM1 domain-containing protein 1 n=1 Tax=Hylaeus anthracinus TaxID=313031 RepID=UPI0023B9F557|nr:LETM1 domain-containing protein 1 [Hylaeus anthracinus]